MLLLTSTYSKIRMGRAGVVRQGVLFNSAKFELLASEIAQDFRTDLAFTCEAYAALQCSAEAYMVRCEHQQCAIAVQATRYIISFAWVTGRALPRRPSHGDSCWPTHN